MGRWTDIAQWEGTPNHGGPMSGHRGLVLHIASGYYQGTIDWQRHAPVGQRVSSHFITGRAGQLCQMVDTDSESWAQMAGNAAWLSIENEGFAVDDPQHGSHPGWERLTDAQIDKVARVFLKGHQVYGYPLKIANSPNDYGLGHHSMGPDWGHQSCPGNAIISQKGAIVARAIELQGGTPAPHNPTLSIGSTGALVRTLQARCNAVPGTGADIAVDGQFGPLTEAKVKRVQAHFHIAVDGIAGPITQGKLGM